MKYPLIPSTEVQTSTSKILRKKFLNDTIKLKSKNKTKGAKEKRKTQQQTGNVWVINKVFAITELGEVIIIYNGAKVM